MKFEDVVGKLYPQRAKGVEADKIPWDNPDYIFEVKYDGDRRLLYLLDTGNINTSRSKSASTGLPVEKTDNVPHLKNTIFEGLHGTILDGEFIHERGFQEGVRKIMGCLPDKAVQRQEEWGPIHFKVFDIISYKGKFVYDKPLHERKSLLKTLYNIQLYKSPYISLVEECHGTPKELQYKLTEIINSGGEGMVAKNINSNYRISTEKCQSPLKNAWIKIKREFNGDFVITGYDEPSYEYTGEHLDTHPYWDGDIPITKYHALGWIGAIRFGEYEDGVLVERGSVSGITEEVRAQISANPESYIGKVIEIDAMERIKKTKALRQPVFKRFRPDKFPEECTYETQRG